MTFSLAGLISHSSPVKASDLDRTAIPAPASTIRVINPVLPVSVPLPAASVTPQATPAQPMVQPIPAVEEEEDQDYNSLAEAVAAQDSADADATQRCLAGAIYFESKGEPLAGQLAVANVIINRSKSGRFPADVCSVVKQRGQFSFVRGGEIPSIDEGRAAWRTALAVARVALAAAWDSPAPKALFFNTPNRRPGGNLTKIAMIGNHVFYR
ncbi:cell wall hydrolase [Sphingomonas sp. RP10(2022)]|uniref:Cell wall hydrolase n=1 Tax=Sphingomonas liriopis TaxID=2949094 RepID=A0A9X2HPK3_9SPHN|nr:cell wall hydrolase [Sphingomonas liriopis]MCP3734042.1 cell wall hydrolase [Sphingomonas liriopis]